MAEIIEPIKKKIKYVEEDSSSDSEAEVLFSLNDRIIKDAKDGKQYIKWKTPLHPPSEEDNVPTFQHPNAPKPLAPPQRFVLLTFSRKRIKILSF